MCEKDLVINEMSKKVMVLSYELAKARCINVGIVIGVGMSVIYLHQKNRKQKSKESEIEEA